MKTQEQWTQEAQQILDKLQERGRNPWMLVTKTSLASAKVQRVDFVRIDRATICAVRFHGESFVALGISRRLPSDQENQLLGCTNALMYALKGGDRISTETARWLFDSVDDVGRKLAELGVNSL